ncbi:MAG: hypothetical protein J6A69_02615 [Clostridia bacterium]|nr:hypothetical protein [Clostridia bacterium]
MAKIAVIGICGNSTFMTVDHFHQNGETLKADSIFTELGGKGINQAVAAKRFGAEVSFLGAAGADCINSCKEFTTKNAINGFWVKKENENTASAFILTDKNGENRVTVYRGAELCIDDVEIFEDEIKSSDVLLLQNEVPEAVNEKAIEIANESNVKVILNPAPARTLKKELCDKIYLVVPNEQEKEFIGDAVLENCITTLGSKGCLVNGEIIPAIKTNVVDTTGAGDTFCGVLAVCIAEGMDLKTSCVRAVTASGLSVSKKHVIDSIPKREEVERRMKNE